jgi:hypothetical protein
MYDIARDLLDALRAAPEVYERLLEGVTQAQAQAARGGDEGWSVVEVMCHLRDAEERALERERTMCDQDHSFLAAYDQEAWARERNYADADLRDAQAAWLRLRAERVTLLSGLTPDQWRRGGRHQEQGDITIEAHVLHMVAHDTIHAAQIARQLDPLEIASIDTR